MASSALRLLATKSQSILLNSSKPRIVIKPSQSRNVTTLETGAVLPNPPKERFGLIKVTAIIVPFLLGGATLSREFAAWLEENELFVPEDDDD